MTGKSPAARRGGSRPASLAVALVAAGLWAAPGVSRAEGRTVEAVLRDLARDPTIDEVQRAALRQGALEPGRARALLARQRWAPALPRVEVSLSRGFERDEDLDRDYQEMDELSLATDQDLSLRCALRWDLDRLIYDPEELRAARGAADLSRRRHELLLAVTRMYYELLLLRAEERLEPSPEPPEALERSLRIAELRALLDALTGGLLSRSAAR